MPRTDPKTGTPPARITDHMANVRGTARGAPLSGARMLAGALDSATRQELMGALELVNMHTLLDLLAGISVELGERHDQEGDDA